MMRDSASVIRPAGEEWEIEAVAQILASVGINGD